MDVQSDGKAGRVPAVPSYLTRFIGRERELVMLLERLVDPSVRWITLTGPGGVGKTRLAIEAVNRERSSDPESAPRSFFVPLFGISDPRLALDTIARRLDPAANDADPLVTIRAAVRGERLILLLDNADGLTHWSHELEALLLLPGCERLTLLCTSRIPFNHIAEHLLMVQPLPLPDGNPASRDEFLTSPAVSLFVDRANAARIDLRLTEDDLELIVAICRRMDGLPLAIELTASKLRQLSLPTVAARVRESPFSVDDSIAPHSLPGHVALRESIASSFALLEPDEREFLLRLSVFTGGISLESARRMAAGFDASRGYPFADGYELGEIFGFKHTGDPGLTALPAWRARKLDLTPLALDPEAALHRLVDRSLLQRTFEPDGTLRFQFLETINEYAREQLEASGELDAANNARMAILLALVEAAGEAYWSAHHKIVTYDRLDDELTNLRLTLEWLIGQGNLTADLAVHLADYLLVYFQMRGLLPEGIDWMNRALANEGENPMFRMGALTQLGFSYWMVGENDLAEERLLESLSLMAGAGLPSHEGRCRFYLALVAWRRGPKAAAEALGHLQEALRLFAVWDDGIGQGVCKLALGEVVRTAGDSATSTRLFEEALALFVNAAYAWGGATARWFLGEAARAAGDERGAATYLAAGLEEYRQIGDRLGMAGCLAGIAALLAARQEWAMAARFFGSASSLREHTSSFLPPTHESDHETVATMVVQTIGPAEFRAGRNGDHAATVAEALRVAKAMAAGRSIESVPFVNVKGLSRPRRQVLLLVAEGKDVKEIASILKRGLSTVYRHIDALMEDFDCQSIEELRQKAILIARPSDE